MSERRCLLLLADGARPDVLEELSRRGDLPNLDRFVREPGSARAAVSVFPSTTGPAHLPYLTGQFPGSCDIPGIRWFDSKAYEERLFSLSRFRSYVGPGAYLLDRDLRSDVRSLFNYVRDHANVFGNCTRGLHPLRHRTRFTKIRLNLMSFLSTSYGATDETCGQLLAESAERRFVFAVLPGIDSESHKAGVRSEGTLAAYRRLDEAVGAVARKLGPRLQDETLLLIVSDHGLTDTERHFDLEELVAEGRGPVLAYPRVWGGLRRAEAAVMVSGNAMAHVHLKGPLGWGDSELARDLAGRLVERPAIDVVAWRAEDGIRIASRRGTARMTLEADDVVYEPRDGDPFGYPPFPARMTRAALLEATADSEYPDGPLQLGQLFLSTRCGDLVVTASPGWDLRARFERPPHRGSHGALYREHMLVPLWSNQPLPSGPIRSVDVFSGVLDWLGLAPPDEVDARPLRIG